MALAEKTKATDFQNLDAEIKRTMRYSAKAVVGLGFLLRRMADQKLWAECYDSFEGYLREELHMDYTMASRFIGINKKYSVDGNSAELEPKWADYSQAALIEMLSMPQELEEKITPDMTVKQIRKVKRAARETVECQETVERPETVGCPEEQVSGMLSEDLGEYGQKNEPEPYEPAEDSSGKDAIEDAEYRELDSTEEVATSQPIVSAYGLEKTEYPEGSLIAVPGCGHRYSCFSCAQECDIRQEARYCRTATLGNPFGCDMMGLMESLKADVGHRCQFVNSTLAFHTQGTGEPTPCCRECEEECEYRCERSRQGRMVDTQETDSPEVSETVPDVGVAYGLTEIKDILQRERRTLNGYLEVGGLPAHLVFKQRTIVTALEAMVHNLEGADLEPLEETAAQPELPAFKNNNQRKEWLGAYKDWGLWYRDENIGVEYYKYDFDNGARLIAEVYREAGRYGDYESCYLHLVGGPEPPKGPYGVGKWARHKRYSRHPNSETELVEFLKGAQQK